MRNKIVIDTSVLVSALIGPNGASREIIRRCLLGELNPLVSTTLIQEYEDVTSREEILSLCPITPDEIRELVNAFYSCCQLVKVYFLWRPNLKDENDNFLIELAVAGNASTIVTNNLKDLKNAELSFPELEIHSPEQFLKGT